MFTESHIYTMLQMQNSMNAIVNPGWRTAGYNWPRAVMVEAVEAIEHHGWKWWKHQAPDMNALHMELVDIWHFMLSQYLQDAGDSDLGDVATDLFNKANLACQHPHREDCHEFLARFNERYYYCKDVDLLDGLQLLVGIAASGKLSLPVFSRCLALSGMTWEDLFRQYVGKNVLNTFRQKHGYKTGSYIKDWSSLGLSHLPVPSGRAFEDNDHLQDILRYLAIAGESECIADFVGDVMNLLEERYQIVVTFKK